MRSPKKTTAIVLAGALGLSSVAYGIGTQMDGGSSVAAAGNNSAANNSGAQRVSIPPGFGGGDRSGPGQARPLAQDLATELGVDATELEAALRDFHESEHADMRSAFSAALAKALGKSGAEVQTAIDNLESQRKNRFAAQLAKALGVDADKVATALEELKDERPGPGKRGEHGHFEADLAEKLGLAAGDVEAALMDLHPDRPDGRRGDHHGMPLRQLAAELGVTRGELCKALREVRRTNGFDQRRADLVKFLADRFELSEAKVEQALPEFAGRGPGGPGGP